MFFIIKRRSKKIPEIPSLYPDLHQELMGSIVGWDPSSIQIMCKSNKQTDLGHNTISLADKNGREAEISCISLDPHCLLNDIFFANLTPSVSKFQT